MKRHHYEITDDSGFLALVDPISYRSFVDTDWTLDQIVRRFKEEMQNRRLLIWGTGREGIWRVEVLFHRSSVTGFREFTASLTSSNDRLLLTNYESLTMAAQFEDVHLPEAHQTNLLIPVRAGRYLCRIVQRFDPESTAPHQEHDPDFRIELTSIKNIANDDDDVSGIPWTDF